MQFIDLQSQLAVIREAIDLRIATVLEHGQFIMGPEVTELETRLADYVGVKHCISCANGTDALQIALMATGVKSGDIVFTTAFSFFATAEIIPLLGARPYFVDIDPRTYNLCPESLEQAILSARDKYPGKSRAVIAVDMFGLPANYPELEQVCEKYQLTLVEDAAQGFGGKINQRINGSFGDIATTSFFPAKPLGCFGDGGALFTNNNELAAISRSIRIHGKGQHKYENVRIGLNSRLDTIQAAILLEKLKIFDDELRVKQRIANYYSERLNEIVQVPYIPEQFRCAWAQFTLQLSAHKRTVIQQALKEKGIPNAVYYPIGLNHQSALKNYDSLPTPHSDKACENVISLPMHAYLSEEQQSLICDAVIQGCTDRK